MVFGSFFGTKTCAKAFSAFMNHYYWQIKLISLPKWVLTPQKETSSHFFNMAIFSKSFLAFMRHIIRWNAGKKINPLSELFSKIFILNIVESGFCAWDFIERSHRPDVCLCLHSINKSLGCSSPVDDLSNWFGLFPTALFKQKYDDVALRLFHPK